MKTELAVNQSAKGALKLAIKDAKSLLQILERLDEDLPYEEMMPAARAVLSDLNQRVHEFNAYKNVNNTR